ncbi:MAG: hypothetical protein ABSC64_22070 [Candidatus Korobacteraceae bacterium]
MRGQSLSAFKHEESSKIGTAALKIDNLERSFSDLIDQKMKADYDAARALPAEEDMDQLLRYDRALQKKLDWALQKLRESQERRQKAQAPVSV